MASDEPDVVEIDVWRQPIACLLLGAALVALGVTLWLGSRLMLGPVWVGADPTATDPVSVSTAA